MSCFNMICFLYTGKFSWLPQLHGNTKVIYSDKYVLVHLIVYFNCLFFFQIVALTNWEFLIAVVENMENVISGKIKFKFQIKIMEMFGYFLGNPDLILWIITFRGLSPAFAHCEQFYADDKSFLIQHSLYSTGMAALKWRFMSENLWKHAFVIFPYIWSMLLLNTATMPTQSSHNTSRSVTNDCNDCSMFWNSLSHPYIWTLCDWLRAWPRAIWLAE